MSNSNVIYLRKRLDKMPPLSERRDCFASIRETLKLLTAFARIESPVFRRMIINTAREAASFSCPPEAEEYSLNLNVAAPPRDVQRSERLVKLNPSVRSR
jgi:hypothetical protein